MNKKYIDLHTHSNASDGSCKPVEIVDLALKQGLTVIALTDHDTVSGIQEFLDYGNKFKEITVVPGVEISVLWQNSEIHLVGLFIDYNSVSLENLLEEIRSNRNKRNDKIIEKLQNVMGFDITLEEIKEIAGGESVGRPHFARVLIQKGYFSETQEVFDKCLKRGTPAYCPRELPSPERAINEIHKAGGLAIWAHPVYRRKGERAFVKKTLNALMKFGLDGIETYYSTFTDKQHKMLEEMAAENNLLVSGGSDFHGKNQPDIQLGTGYGNLHVPEALFLRLNKAYGI